MPHGTALQQRQRLHRLTQMGFLFALTLTLALLESLLPPPPFPIPLRYGLSNIAVMTGLLALGFGQALSLALLKAAFTLMLRGMVAATLSLSGGLCAVVLMGLLEVLSKRRSSYLLLSVVGALGHNMGQFVALSLFYIGASLGAIYPFLMISGLAMGTLTSLFLRGLMPVLAKLSLFKTPYLPFSQCREPHRPFEREDLGQTQETEPEKRDRP